MNKYHKISTVFKRDPENNFKTLLFGEFATPELEYLQDNMWVFTEKVDGTNIRVQYDYDGEVHFRGKSDNAQIPAFLIDKLQSMFDSDSMKTMFSGDKLNGLTACLYGEGYGAKIQKGGGNYRQDQSFVLFDIKIGEWWLKREDVEDIGNKLNIDVVPIIGIGTLHRMIRMAQEGFKSTWGDFLAEGIVARPKIELKTRSGQRIITKIKYKDFPR